MECKINNGSIVDPQPRFWIRKFHHDGSRSHNNRNGIINESILKTINDYFFCMLVAKRIEFQGNWSDAGQ